MSALVHLQLDKIAVYLVGRVFLYVLFGVCQRKFGQFRLFVLPKLLKVGRHGGIRTELFRREAHFDVMGVFLSVYGGGQAAVSEARFLHGAYGDCCLSFSHDDCSFGIGRHHFSAYFEINRYAISRNAVFVKLHFYVCLFSGFVKPVGMIGYGYPEYVTPVGIVFGNCKQRCQ